MVDTTFPPPNGNTPNPLFCTLEKDTKLKRIFRSEFSPKACSFRFSGPYSRFDHHRGNPPRINYHDRQQFEPSLDPERGILYVAFTLSSCLVEVFGKTRCVEITDHQYATLTLKKNLKLLDVRGSGAMRAGANAATLAKTPERSISQAWSRYFYEQKQIYSEIQGIIYLSAHNDEDAIAFYERTENFLVCEHVLPLKHPDLRGRILKAAKDNNLRVIPNWLNLAQFQDSERMIRI